jgi:hypothetical protein
MRFQNWGWTYALTPNGLQEIGKRVAAHRECTYLPLLDAALSWRLGRDVARHEAADELAGEAERLGMKPSISPDEGENAIWDRHRVWFLTPALAENTPIVSSVEHAQFGEAVDELERQVRRLESVEELKESNQSLDSEQRPDAAADRTKAPGTEPHPGNVSGEPNPTTISLSPGVNGNQIVLLIHGIRTQAEWGPMVRSKIEIPGQVEVVPIKYGYFDALRFWFPF